MSSVKSYFACAHQPSHSPPHRTVSNLWLSVPLFIFAFKQGSSPLRYISNLGKATTFPGFRSHRGAKDVTNDRFPPQNVRSTMDVTACGLRTVHALWDAAAGPSRSRQQSSSRRMSKLSYLQNPPMTPTLDDASPLLMNCLHPGSRYFLTGSYTSFSPVWSSPSSGRQCRHASPIASWHSTARGSAAKGEHALASSHPSKHALGPWF